MNHAKLKITTIIVDDEELSRKYLRRLLSEHSDIEVIAECSDGKTALEMISKLRPRLVFLDIQMPGMDGFGVLDRLNPKTNPAIVFVTTYDQFAVRAFQAHALEYIVKPYDEVRLRKALDYARSIIGDSRLLSELEKQLKTVVKIHNTQTSDKALTASELGFNADSQMPNTVAVKYLKRITIKGAVHRKLIPVDEIDWIKSVAPYVEVHSRGKKYLLRQKIGWLEKRLDPAQFVRIHRSILVRIQNIKGLCASFGGGYMIELGTGEILPLSRRRRKHLERTIGM